MPGKTGNPRNGPFTIIIAAFAGADETLKI
jgi:hypothetical protein